LNSDDRLDLIAVDADRPWSLSLLLGNGDGTFQQQKRMAAGPFAHLIMAADLNRDGRIDLVTASDQLDGVSVFLNRLAPDCNRNGLSDSCDIRDGTSADRNRNSIPDECEITFHRGDPDSSGAADISDGIVIFDLLFFGGRGPSCKESSDVNNDGVINLSDGIHRLHWLFLGGPEPPPPGPPAAPCGMDPDPPASPGDLGCGAYAACN
jgi:hypothetical protein